jgi:hypothetical protein
VIFSSAHKVCQKSADRSPIAERNQTTGNGLIAQALNSIVFPYPLGRNQVSFPFPGLATIRRGAHRSAAQGIINWSDQETAFVPHSLILQIPLQSVQHKHPAHPAPQG